MKQCKIIVALATFFIIPIISAADNKKPLSPKLKREFDSIFDQVKLLRGEVNKLTMQRKKIDPILAKSYQNEEKAFDKFSKKIKSENIDTSYIEERTKELDRAPITREAEAALEQAINALEKPKVKPTPTKPAPTKPITKPAPTKSKREPVSKVKESMPSEVPMYDELPQPQEQPQPISKPDKKEEPSSSKPVISKPEKEKPLVPKPSETIPNKVETFLKTSYPNTLAFVRSYKDNPFSDSDNNYMPKKIWLDGLYNAAKLDTSDEETRKGIVLTTIWSWLDAKGVGKTDKDIVNRFVQENLDQRISQAISKPSVPAKPTQPEHPGLKEFKEQESKKHAQQSAQPTQELPKKPIAVKPLPAQPMPSAKPEKEEREKSKPEKPVQPMENPISENVYPYLIGKGTENNPQYPEIFKFVKEYKNDPFIHPDWKFTDEWLAGALAAAKKDVKSQDDAIDILKRIARYWIPSYVSYDKIYSSLKAVETYVMQNYNK